ncbi:MAG: hypothetical protein P8X82_14930, partial [Gemmatimonadales bacterium]
SLITAIMSHSPREVDNLRTELPHHLSRIIRHCLEKDPERRFQTAKEVRNELEDLKTETDSGELVERVTSAKSTVRTRWISLSALALVVAAVVAYLLWTAPTTPTQPIRTKLTQLTSRAGTEHFPSISPDGDSLVYASENSGNWDIYLQRVAGQRAINLTEDSVAADTQPAFSPDGAQIAFRSDRDGGGLFLMGATGESVKRLADFGYNPAWSPDGEFIVFSTMSRSSSMVVAPRGELRVVQIETGEIRAIDINGGAEQPHWSPGGHRIVFWSNSLSERNYRDIWTVPAQGGEVVPVTRDEYIDWNPVWSHDGKFIYFSSNRGGTMSLWRVAVEEETGRVLGDPDLIAASAAARLGHISISRDDRRIVYRADVGTWNIQKIAFDPDSETVVGDPVAITRGSKLTAEPDPSPDGSLLAFNIYAGGGQADVAVVQTDGTSLRQLTNAPHDATYTPRWSPDGSRLAFYSIRSGTIDIWTIQPDGSNLKQLTDSSFDTIGFTWSPDGAQMAYWGGDTSHIFSTEVPWEEQTPEDLPAMADGDAFDVDDWSPDGTKLAGVVYDTSIVSIYSIQGRKYQRFPMKGLPLRWLRDSRRLLYRWEGTISLLDTMTGEHHEVLSVAPDFIASFGLARDDRWIYFDRLEREADIWMLALGEASP